MITMHDHPSKLESPTKLALRDTILSVATAVFVTSCASAPPTSVHETVGPNPAAVLNQEHNGFLTVYSATAWTTDGDGGTLLNHTDYDIDAPDGRLVERVPNAAEEPTRATLLSGIYTVIAQSETSGTVSVPVVIEPGKITILHLEKEKDWQESSVIRSSDLVRLPNGQPIGFRAQHPDLLKRLLVAVAQSKP